MAKLYTYMMVTIGIWAMLTILGVTISGAFISSHLGITDPDSVQSVGSSPLWNLFTGSSYLGALTISAIAIVLISIVSRNISVLPISGSLALIFLVIMSDMASIFNVVGGEGNEWMQWILFAIFVPWIAGFIIVLWDWVRSGGSD